MHIGINANLIGLRYFLYDSDGLCAKAYHFSPSVNDLKDFLDDVVEDETEEDDLNAKNKMVPSIDVAQELVTCLW